MQEGLDVHVHGVVSERLLRGLTEWQLAWSRWRPERYHQVQITVDDVGHDVPTTDGAVAAFSGGVDAAYTLLRHVNRDAEWQTAAVSAVVMVHGFDIPLQDSEVFTRAAERVRRMLDGLDIELITVSTNLRDLLLSWEDFHALALAASMQLLAPEFSIGLIGSSEPYRRMLFPWGSNPATDHLLSSNLIEIRHDGAGASRTDKVRYIARSDRMTKNLRFCWQGDRLDRNCGRCEKCQRTHLNFRLAGVDDSVCFEDPFIPDPYVILKGVEPQNQWRTLLEEARERHDDPIERDVQRVLNYNRLIYWGNRTRVLGILRRTRRLVSRFPVPLSPSSE